MMTNKKNKLNDTDFYFITDRNISGKNMISHVKDAIKAGVKIIQYRDNEASTKEKIEIAKKIKKLAEGKAIFIVNNDVGFALAVNADGVHLGQEDMPYDDARRLLGRNKIIGLTVHNMREALNAEKKGADYIALSPIFETTTKPDAGKPSGLELIREARKKIKIPFTAIGGINQDNLDDVLNAGAKSVVMISAVLSKKDVKWEIKRIRAIINSQ